MSDNTAGELAAKWRADARQLKTWSNVGGGPGPSSMLAAEADAMRRCAEELEKAFGIGPPHDQPNMFAEQFMWQWEQSRPPTR